jgi:hypothetical protein
MVRASNQRPRFDMCKSHANPGFLQIGEFGGGHVTHDRKVFWRGTKVLSECEDIYIVIP